MFDLFIVVFKGKYTAWFVMVSVIQKSFHSTLSYLAVTRHKMSFNKKNLSRGGTSTHIWSHNQGKVFI